MAGSTVKPCAVSSHVRARRAAARHDRGGQEQEAEGAPPVRKRVARRRSAVRTRARRSARPDGPPTSEATLSPLAEVPDRLLLPPFFFGMAPDGPWRGTVCPPVASRRGEATRGEPRSSAHSQVPAERWGGVGPPQAPRRRAGMARVCTRTLLFPRFPPACTAPAQRNAPRFFRRFRSPTCCVSGFVGRRTVSDQLSHTIKIDALGRRPVLGTNI